jgi:hypothetical protein
LVSLKKRENKTIEQSKDKFDGTIPKVERDKKERPVE